MYFVIRHIPGLSKVPNVKSMSKIISWFFYLLKNINLWAHNFLFDIFDNINFWSISFLKWCLMFGSLAQCLFSRNNNFLSDFWNFVKYYQILHNFFGNLTTNIAITGRQGKGRKKEEIVNFFVARNVMACS